MAGTKPAAPPRLFVDSGVVIDAVVAEWSVPRCVFVLARCGVFKIVLAEAVRLEVENDFLRRLGNDEVVGTKIMNAYSRLLRLVRPERVPLPPAEQVAESRHLIRHAADVPILRSAITAAPDWLVTTNTRHFTPEVGVRCGIKIITPRELVRRTSFLP
jgi:hypothetical protein